MVEAETDPESARARRIEAAFAADGMPAARVTGLSRLSGGASKENWAFELSADGATRPLVLRTAPSESRFEAAGVVDLSTEAALLRAALAAGVPVPEVVCELTGEQRGYAMTRIAGETVGTRILKDARLADIRPGLARQCGAILARVHAIPPEVLPALDTVTAGQGVAMLGARYRATGQHRPVFDLALCWLEDRLPGSPATALVHGDFRNGNLIVGPDGIRAVLDWETAHLGCPGEDLGWLCAPSWRFQRPDLPVGGFGTREALLAGYRQAGGAEIAADELRFWEAFAILRWGVMCAEVAARFADGVRSVEGAMIARRASETEYDLLQLMAGGGA